MATSTAKKRSAAKKTPTPGKLNSFLHDVREEHPDFAFTRYWYQDKKDREGISGWIDRKVRLGDDPKFGQATKAEVLLPATAPADYVDLAFLTRRYDEALPNFEKHAMIQTKIYLDPNEAWHHAYERVRAFARSHFAHRFPVILIGHVPSCAGLHGNGSHVHVVVLPRGLTLNGLTEVDARLCSDKGYASALDAWREHKTAWSSAA